MTVKWSGQVLKVIILKLGSCDNRLKTSTFCRDTVSQKKLKMGGRVRRKDTDNNREEDRERKREREREREAFEATIGIIELLQNIEG